MYVCMHACIYLDTFIYKYVLAIKNIHTYIHTYIKDTSTYTYIIYICIVVLVSLTFPLFGNEFKFPWTCMLMCKTHHTTWISHIPT